MNEQHAQLNEQLNKLKEEEAAHNAYKAETSEKIGQIMQLEKEAIQAKGRCMSRLIEEWIYWLTD